MGAVLALAFQAHGHTVTVWNRTAAKAALLAAKGIHVAPSVDDAVAGADIVVGNLLDYAATLALLSPARSTSARRSATRARSTPRSSSSCGRRCSERGTQRRMVVVLDAMHSDAFTKMQAQGFTSQLEKLDAGLRVTAARPARRAPLSRHGRSARARW